MRKYALTIALLFVADAVAGTALAHEPWVIDSQTDWEQSTTETSDLEIKDGVANPTGDDSAGKSLLETSLELRQRLFGNFGAVAFVDAGTVGPDSFVDFSEDLSVGVGLGVRYYTSLGPIRVDVAVPLNKNSGDSDFAIYAGIGQAF